MKDQKLEPQRTERGFSHMPPLIGRYQGSIRTYESSGATPCIWVNVVDPNGTEATVLLTLADAQVFSDQIASLIEHHWSRRGL